MPADSLNIYGLDETGQATAASAKALSSPFPYAASGQPIDNEAKSRSSSDASLKLDDASPEATAKITKLGLNGGNPKSKGNH